MALFLTRDFGGVQTAAASARKRLLKALAVLAGAMSLAAAGLYGVYWVNWEQQVVWDRWAVSLPKGGSVEYRNQSPRTHSFGPSDTTRLLLWRDPRGRERVYLIDMIGAAITVWSFGVARTAGASG